MTWSFHIKIHSFMSFKICNSIFCFKQVAPYPSLSQMKNAVDEKLTWESYEEKSMVNHSKFFSLIQPNINMFIISSVEIFGYSCHHIVS
jgi:hypothetical protein